MGAPYTQGARVPPGWEPLVYTMDFVSADKYNESVVLVRVTILRELNFFVRPRPTLAGIWEISPAPALRARPALFPSQTCTCHGKPLKTHATCFIAGDSLFSDSSESQRKGLEKHH